MQAIDIQLVRQVVRLLLMLCALAAAPAISREPDASGTVDPRLDAFDGAVVGYEGMAVDMKVVKVAYDEIDYLIADYQKQIEDAQALINVRKKSGGARSEASLQELEHDISLARARIRELQLKKAIRDADVCSELEHWQELLDLLTDDREVERNYELESPAGSDVRAMFHEQVKRDDGEISIAHGKVKEVSTLCTMVTEANSAERVDVALGKLNEKAKTAGEEAMAIAANGHFGSLSDVTEKLQIVLGAAKANQMFGKEIGLVQWKLASSTLEKFAAKASTVCLNDSFNFEQAQQMTRQLQLLNIEVDLSACQYRLYETGGGRIPGIGNVAFRTCAAPNGQTTWEIRVKTVHETFSGSGDTAQANGIHGTVTLESDGTGTAEMSGMFYPKDNVWYPFDMNMEGPVEFKAQEIKGPFGLETRREMRMRTRWSVEQYTTQNVFGRKVTVPAYELDEEDEPVVILNENKPCDPAKSVWSYP